MGLAGFGGTTLLLQFRNLGILNITGTDIGWFLVMFTVITAIFLLGSLKISAMLALTFITLFAGFIFLDISHLGGPAVYTTVAAVDLIICALSAWYLMAHNVFAQLGWNLPVGKPWIK